VIAHRYAGVAHLIRRVESQFRGEFDDGAGVDITVSLIAGVPLSSQSEAMAQLLLECKLTSRPIGCGYDILCKVISAESDASAFRPLFRESCVKIIASAVRAVADWEKQVVSDVEGPA